MKPQVTSNKHGQALGPKGHATRKRLMDAAEKLLKVYSPVELTTVAIAKEAKTSSATFYMYFDDVRDILFALCMSVGAEVADAIESHRKEAESENAEEKATRLVKTFHKVWASHREILRYRSIEAAQANSSFGELRLEAYQREINIFVTWIRHFMPDGKKVSEGDAHALAMVLHAALERLASFEPIIVEKGIGEDRFIAAQARIIAQVLTDTPKWGKLPIGK